MTHTDFGDLNPEITLVPIAELVPFHRRTDADLRVKRLKEPSSSAELVLVWPGPFNKLRRTLVFHKFEF